MLGLRLLLQCEGETPLAAPVVLMFHGEDQNIDTFCEEERMAVGEEQLALSMEMKDVDMMIYEDI